MKSVGAIGIFATLVLLVFRYQLFHLFIPDDSQAIALGAVYLFIFGLCQFFMSIEIGGSGFLSGIGDTRTPALINSIFNILRIPLALILMPAMGVAGVWVAMSLSSVFKRDYHLWPYPYSLKKCLAIEYGTDCSRITIREHLPAVSRYVLLKIYRQDGANGRRGLCAISRNL